MTTDKIYFVLGSICNFQSCKIAPMQSESGSVEKCATINVQFSTGTQFFFPMAYSGSTQVTFQAWKKLDSKLRSRKRTLAWTGSLNVSPIEG